MLIKYDRVRPSIDIEVNELNPNFDYLTGLNNKFIYVKVLVKNDKKEWIEKIKVSNLEIAEKEVKEVIRFFNDTIVNPKELKRKFISLITEDEEVKKYKDRDGLTGWLTPEGKFYPCNFGEHWKMASELIKTNDIDVREKIEKNQYISMYDGVYVGKKSYITILGKLTEPQSKWFRKFADKLSFNQYIAVSNKFKEQSICELLTSC